MNPYKVQKNTKKHGKTEMETEMNILQKMWQEKRETKQKEKQAQICFNCRENKKNHRMKEQGGNLRRSTRHAKSYNHTDKVQI